MDFRVMVSFIKPSAAANMKQYLMPSYGEITHRSTYVNYWVHVHSPNGSRTWNENVKQTKYISRALSTC